jgi:hypothetical protein
MAILAFLFFAMFIYGVFSGHLGAACISLLMACFVLLARDLFAKQDEDDLKDPTKAKCPKSTEQCLCDGECECTRDRI